MSMRNLVAALAVAIMTATAGVPALAATAEQLEANKVVARRFLGALEAGDMAAIRSLSSPGVSYGARGESARGEGKTLKEACPMCAALSDRQIVIDFMVAEGDLVTVRSIWTGTYTGEYRGVAVPTPTPVRVIYTNIYRIKDGRVTDNYFVSDQLVLAEQLGFTLSPPATSTP